MIPAALVCEGGAFRGLYAGGVMDSLLKNELEFEMTVGVSAGSLCACNYISRQYRRTLALNRLYRKDSRYVGKEALRNSGGVIDVGFVFSEEVQQKCPWDTETFYGTDQKFYIVATDCKTGKPAYFEHKEWDVPTAVRASTGMPFAMPMVPLGDSVYLDGGISDYTPVLWAMEQGYEKIVVVCTRPLNFRKDSHSKRMLEWARYKHYPKLLDALERSDDLYNRTRRLIQQLNYEGRIFVLQPSDPSLAVSRLEGNIDRLTDWYLLGEQDTDRRMQDLKQYLER